MLIECGLLSLKDRKEKEESGRRPWEEELDGHQVLGFLMFLPHHLCLCRVRCSAGT